MGMPPYPWLHGTSVVARRLSLPEAPPPGTSHPTCDASYTHVCPSSLTIPLPASHLPGGGKRGAPGCGGPRPQQDADGDGAAAFPKEAAEASDTTGAGAGGDGGDGQPDWFFLEEGANVFEDDQGSLGAGGGGVVGSARSTASTSTASDKGGSSGAWAAEAAAATTTCGALSRELLLRWAVNNTVLITFTNSLMWANFGPTWLHNVRKAGIKYWVSREELRRAAVEGLPRSGGGRGGRSVPCPALPCPAWEGVLCMERAGGAGTWRTLDGKACGTGERTRQGKDNGGIKGMCLEGRGVGTGCAAAPPPRVAQQPCAPSPHLTVRPAPRPSALLTEPGAGRG